MKGREGRSRRAVATRDGARRLRYAGLLLALCLLTSAATAHAESAWILWSKVYIMKDGEIADHFYSAEAFASKPECEKAARHYEENYKGEGTRAYFKCFRYTIDPRESKEK